MIKNDSSVFYTFSTDDDLFETNMSKPICTNYLWITGFNVYLLRVQNEQFSEEKGFILRDTEKEV